MSNIKTAAAGVLVGAGVLASGQAMADVSGSLNLTSEYMFRGIESSDGAAVQGSLDWSSPGGVYAGLWASNATPVVTGGTELDLYVGWAGELGSGLGIDLGVVYYGFTEEDEVNGDASYGEIYAGLSLGGLSGSIYYTDDYFGVDDDGFYYTLAYSHGVNETVDLTFQIGLSDGDGVDAVFGDSYTDWSITLSKDLSDGWGASFGYVQTDLDNGTQGLIEAANSDDPKFVVSLSKEFSL